MAFYDLRKWQTELYHSLKLAHVVESKLACEFPNHSQYNTV